MARWCSGRERAAVDACADGNQRHKGTIASILHAVFDERDEDWSTRRWFSAEDAVGSLERLVNLHNANTALINESLGRSATNGQRLLELLEGDLIVDVAFVVEKLDIARTTASNLVKGFVDMGILVQRKKEKQRYRTFPYEDYLSILRQGSDPL